MRAANQLVGSTDLVCPWHICEACQLAEFIKLKIRDVTTHFGYERLWVAYPALFWGCSAGLARLRACYWGGRQSMKYEVFPGSMECFHYFQ